MQKDLMVEEHQAREARLNEEHHLHMSIGNAELKLKEIQILNEEADLKIKLAQLRSMESTRDIYE
jgi:hypothetical protein